MTNVFSPFRDLRSTVDSLDRVAADFADADRVRFSESGIVRFVPDRDLYRRQVFETESHQLPVKVDFRFEETERRKSFLRQRTSALHDQELPVVKERPECSE